MTGEELKAKIKGAGLTVKDVAEHLGTSQQNLSAKLGRQNVKIELVKSVDAILKQYATALDDTASVGNVLNGNDNKNVYQSIGGDVSLLRQMYEDKAKEVERLNRRIDQLLTIMQKGQQP